MSDLKLESLAIGQRFRVGKTEYELVRRSHCSAAVKVSRGPRTFVTADDEQVTIQGGGAILRIALGSIIDEVLA